MVKLFYDHVDFSDEIRFFFCGKEDRLYFSSFSKKGLLKNTIKNSITLEAASSESFLFQKEIRSYLNGNLRKFKTSPVFLLISPYFRKTLEYCYKNVAYGTTWSYSELARNTGNPAALRATGSAMKCNPIPILIPCHRIIRKNGNAGEYSAGKNIKNFLLSLENDN